MPARCAEGIDFAGKHQTKNKMKTLEQLPQFPNIKTTDAAGRRAFCTSMSAPGNWFLTPTRGDKSAMVKRGLPRTFPLSGLRLRGEKVECFRWVGNGYWTTQTV